MTNDRNNPFSPSWIAFTLVAAASFCNAKPGVMLTHKEPAPIAPKVETIAWLETLTAKDLDDFKRNHQAKHAKSKAKVVVKVPKK